MRRSRLLIGLAVVVGIALLFTRSNGPRPAVKVARADSLGNGFQHMDDGDPGFRHMNHVFVIMMENNSRADILDPTNPGTPYIRSLASQYGSALNYDGVTHPSAPNYIALTSGSTWGSAADDTSQEKELDHTNIVDDLERSGVSWKAYMESAPYPGYLGGRYMDPNGSGAYAPAHNPFVFYPDIVNNPERLNKVVPLTQLDTDIANNQVPDYAWITPNLCHDMHIGPGCYQLDEPSLQKLGDDFIHEWVTKIMNSKAWTGNSTIFITWDEGTGSEYCCDSRPATDTDLATNPAVNGGGNVPLIAISREGSRGYTNSDPYNHYSLLQTIEDNWGLERLGFTSDSQQVHSLAPFLNRANR